MIIRISFCFSLWYMGTTGEQLDFSNIEDRFNLLEEDLRKTDQRLKFTERINQELEVRLTDSELRNQRLEYVVTETQLRNQDLEKRVSDTQVKYQELEQNFKNSLTTIESKLLDLYNKYEHTEADLLQNKENIKYIHTELINNNAKLKLSDADLTVTVEKLKNSDADFENTLFMPGTDFRNTTEYITSAEHSTSEIRDMILNIKNTTNGPMNIDDSKGNRNMFQKVKRVDELGSMIAFHYMMYKDNTNLTAGQTVQFEVVKQNIGNAYDPHYGIFTCPKSGLYFFTTTIMALPRKQISVKIVANGSPVVWALASPPPTFYSTGTASCIIPLHPGDRVSVEFYAYNTTIHGDGWSTFTGFMIKEA